MKFPCAVVFRNEVIRSGKDLPECASQEEMDRRTAEYKIQAKNKRSFAVWVAIEYRTGKEIELARGEN